MPRVPLVLLVVLVGCGDPLSNQLLLEDDLFRTSLPARDDVATDAPRIEDAGARDLGERADLVTTTVAVSEVYNGIVFSLLGVVDGIIENDVTRREEDLRIWGPWPGRRDGTSARLVVTRAEDALFAYSLEVAPVPAWQADDATEWQILMEGVFERGASLREGDGEFRFDASVWSVVDARFDDATGELLVGHARSGERVRVDAICTSLQFNEKDRLDDASYRYRGGDGLGGFFEYATTGDLVGQGEDAESYVIRSRWTAELTGRADYLMTGGSVGEVVVPGSECWDGELLRTWFLFDGPGTEFDVEEGDEASCVFAREEPGTDAPGL